MIKIKKIRVNLYRVLLITGLLLLQACETMGPEVMEKRQLGQRIATNAEPIRAAYSEQNPAHVSSNNTAEATAVTSINTAEKAEIYQGSGVYIKPSKAIKSVLSDKQDGSYTLNFSNVDVTEVVKIILGDTLKSNFVVSPDVNGKVSLQTTAALSKDELLPTLQMLLRMNGAVLVEEEGLYRVQATDVALSSGNIPLTTSQLNGSSGFQIRVIPLKFIGVQEFKKILQPVLPKRTLLQIDVNRNLLFVAGSPAELLNTQELVRLFDVDIMQGKSVGLYPLRFVSPELITKELTEIFAAEGGDSLSGVLRMLPVERMNALMVISTQASYLGQIDTWIKRLDRSGLNDNTGGVHVYKVQNVDALELSNILQQIYVEQGARTANAAQPVSIAPGLQAARVESNTNRQLATDQPTASNRQANPSTVTSGEAQGPIRIIADEINNALVIVASAQDYESLKRVIQQLDVTPLQVLVDATIVEVSLTDELHYGLQWFFNNRRGGYTGSGTVGDSNIAAALGGFSYSVVNSADFVRAELNALANDSHVNVVSAPSLMILNNQEATIKVGDQVPIRTSESANTNSGVLDSAIITSTIQMRDTGVTLTVRPRVNAGGLVIMEIEQNVDGVSRTESSAIDSPTIQQRQIKSSVAVQDGETIVLGGLITEQREQGRSGVPVLSRLPVIGGLFGKTDKVLDRTELVVLLTPRVVKNQHDARLVTQDFKAKLSGIYEQFESGKKTNASD